MAENCSNGQAVQPDTVFNEFYEINQAAPVPKLDTAEANLIPGGQLGGLTNEQRLNYNTLLASLNKLEASVIPCPGDVNLDMKVDANDVTAWRTFATTAPALATQNGGGKGSWADFGGPNGSTLPDGRTDENDRNIILANLGKVCQ